MLEFTECNFFTNYNAANLQQGEESAPELTLTKEHSEHSLSTHSDSEHSFEIESQITSKRSYTSKVSDNHNMVKQLVITMKQMVGKFIEDIGSSHSSRKIISQTWRVLEKAKCPNKELLKAMFDRELNKKLVEKVGLGPIVNNYGAYAFQNAMEELRMDILLRMRTESVKSHLFNRNIQKKDRLTAYIQYFVGEELKNGCISSRFSQAAGKRMNEILENNKNQADFIDYYFDNSHEVFDRFTSTQATY